MSGALNDKELQQLATEAYLSDPIPVVRCMTDKAIRKLEELLRERHAALVQPASQAKAATRTLQQLGYTYHGGEMWKLPLGKPSEWVDGGSQEQALPAISEQDATLLAQAHDMLLAHADEQRRKGNDSEASGAECSADAVLRLGAQPASQEQADAATSAGTQAAMGHLSRLVDEATGLLSQLRAMVDDMHKQWSNGGPPERGEVPLLDQVDDWLSARPGQEQAQQPSGGEVLFWYRPCGDGLYEGPLHEQVTPLAYKQSGDWKPLTIATPKPQSSGGEVVGQLPGSAHEEWQKVVRIAAQVARSSMVPVKAHALLAVDERFRTALPAQANGGAA